MANFRSQSLTKRQKLSEAIRNKYEDHVPLIIDTSELQSVKELKKTKYVVPRDTRLAHVFFEVQRYTLGLSAHDAIFFFVRDSFYKSILPAAASTVGSIYDQYRDVDGFLYLHVRRENTFG